jgi:hypothetical protein
MNTLTVAGQKSTMETKPRVLVAVFCGTERNHWLCPQLVGSLLQMGKDTRFAVEIEMIYSLTPTDFARNTAVTLARKRSADWLLMLDNDTAPQADPLTLIQSAPSNADIVAMPYGSNFGNKYTVAAEFLPGVASGDFLGVKSIGTGAMALRSSVWQQKIPKGPWFKVVSDETSELYKPLFSEDIYFCNLARAAGLSIFVHRSAGAAHFHTVNVTDLARVK